MIRTIAGRYLLFGVLGIESLLLPYFLSKNVYGEVEFLKFTGFLFQFALFGAGTGYIVRYLKEEDENRSHLTSVFLKGSLLQACLLGGLSLFFVSWPVAALAVLAMFAMTLESIVKVRERYLLAMAYKPVLSLLLILFIPLYLLMHLSLEYYVLSAFSLATCIYAIIVFRCGRFSSQRLFSVDGTWCETLENYGKNISAGLLINLSTALTFAFFYIDRAVVREKFPKLLGDYSLSYAIMQLTIVAITVFSYVNVVEFGKEHDNPILLKAKIHKAFRQCLLFYMGFGVISVAFAYGAEKFYGYHEVFETTALMVGLFGLANVMGSINAAHLYLGSIKTLAVLIFISFIISVTLNEFIPYDKNYGYYILLSKTYGIYFIFSVLSFSYINLKLRLINRPTDN